jgi:hypothetical protein
MENTGRSTRNPFDVGEHTNELLAYCGIFAEGTIVKPAERAVAEEWLCKELPLVGSGSRGHPNRHGRNNGVTVGRGVFCAVSHEML